MRAHPHNPQLVDDFWPIIPPPCRASIAGCEGYQHAQRSRGNALCAAAPGDADESAAAAGGAATRSLVAEGGVVEVDRGKRVLLAPVILIVLPFRLVAALRQQVHAAHQVAGIEVLRI